MTSPAARREAARALATALLHWVALDERCDPRPPNPVTQEAWTEATDAVWGQDGAMDKAAAEGLLP